MTERWGTNEQMDRRHKDVIRRFPGGLSFEQFVYLTLESARDDTGIVEPPSVVGPRVGCLMRMFFDRLIDSIGRRDEPMCYRITAQGRARLAEIQALHPEWNSTRNRNRRSAKVNRSISGGAV
jgi:hypothetical protein